MAHEETEKQTDAGAAGAPAAAAADEATAPAAAAAKPPVSYEVPAGAARAGGLPFEMPRISRRVALLAGFWTSMATIGACAAGGTLDLVYPRKIAGFGGTVSPGTVNDFPPGSKTHFVEGRFWVVHLTAEQGGPGLLALWQKCPHLGCTVPWRPEFIWPDPDTGADKQGWFRCPCHGSTYTDAGVRVFGPAPRSMDTMKLTVDDRGNVTVDTGDIAQGSLDNASRAVPV